MEANEGGSISAVVKQVLTRMDDDELEEEPKLQQIQSLLDAITSAADTWQLDSQVPGRDMARLD